MSDIVQRLRDSATQARAIDRAALLKEAAAEISRIRRKLLELNHAVDSMISECQKLKSMLADERKAAKCHA